MVSARERFNAIRKPKAEQSEQGQRPTGPQPAGPENAPSAIAGTPGFEKWLEHNGMIEAFRSDEDDAWTKRIRGY
jgi:hypothetical protein